MPYIDKKRRNDLSDLENCAEPKHCGELNYFLTQICLDYLHSTEKKYKDYNEIIGVLECCKLEFYRRTVSRYEDLKILENGDVY